MDKISNFEEILNYLVYKAREANNPVPDALIALGIKHQIKYPLYYIKKLGLKISKEQEGKILLQRVSKSQQHTNGSFIYN